nr:unnamed protein product [Spirometra erinaceieuropaei]
MGSFLFQVFCTYSQDFKLKLRAIHLTLVGSVSGNIVLTLVWSRLSRSGYLIGCFGSAVAAMAAWLGTESALYESDSEESLKNLPIFAAAVTAFCCGFLLPMLWSGCRSSQLSEDEERVVWLRMQDVDCPLTPWPEIYSHHAERCSRILLDKRRLVRPIQPAPQEQVKEYLHIEVLTTNRLANILGLFFCGLTPVALAVAKDLSREREVKHKKALLVRASSTPRVPWTQKMREILSYECKHTIRRYVKKKIEKMSKEIDAEVDLLFGGSKRYRADCSGRESSNGRHWSYRQSDTGPKNWHLLHPDACAGQRQSPVNLDSEEALELAEADQVELKIKRNVAVQEPEKLQAWNNGHTHVQFTMEEEVESKLPFLDVLVCRQPDGKLVKSIYRKATNTLQMLSFNSNHSLKHKQSRGNSVLYGSRQTDGDAFMNSSESTFIREHPSDGAECNKGGGIKTTDSQNHGGAFRTRRESPKPWLSPSHHLE